MVWVLHQGLTFFKWNSLFILSICYVKMTTIVFNCNDLSVSTMDPRTFTTWVGGKDVRDNNESFSLVFRYKGIQLTKGLKDTIENNNGIID